MYLEVVRALSFVLLYLFVRARSTWHFGLADVRDSLDTTGRDMLLNSLDVMGYNLVVNDPRVCKGSIGGEFDPVSMQLTICGFRGWYPFEVSVLKHEVWHVIQNCAGGCSIYNELRIKDCSGANRGALRSGVAQHYRPDHVAIEMEARVAQRCLGARQIHRYLERTCNTRSARVTELLRGAIHHISATRPEWSSGKALLHRHCRGRMLLMNGTRGWAEYRLPAFGLGVISVRLLLKYAAEDRRPLQVLLNGEAIPGKICDGMTLGWTDSTWGISPDFILNSGNPHILRLETEGYFPHLSELAMTPSRGNNTCNAAPAIDP